MNPAPRTCPVCSDTLTITRLDCRNCGTSLTGSFSLSGLAQLSPVQLNFVETFIKCEGKFNRMEKEYNLSYPTLRSRLKEIILALGYTVEDKIEPKTPSLSAEERTRILDKLSAGEIDFDEAMNLLGD